MSLEIVTDNQVRSGRSSAFERAPRRRLGFPSTVASTSEAYFDPHEGPRRSRRPARCCTTCSCEGSRGRAGIELGKRPSEVHVAEGRGSARRSRRPQSRRSPPARGARPRLRPDRRHGQSQQRCRRGASSPRAEVVLAPRREIDPGRGGLGEVGSRARRVLGTNRRRGQSSRATHASRRVDRVPET